MTEWWTCQTLALPRSACMSPSSAPRVPIWDPLAYPRQFAARFNIIHICWVKSNSKAPIQRSQKAMTHFRSPGLHEACLGSKAIQKCKTAGHTNPYLLPGGTNPFWPDISRLLPWYSSTTVLFDFYSKCSGKKEEKEQKAACCHSWQWVCRIHWPAEACQSVCFTYQRIMPYFDTHLLGKYSYSDSQRSATAIDCEKRTF